MKAEHRIIRAALALVVSALAACASTSPGTDGETHFACRADADCVAHGMAGPCVAGTCAAGDGGLADSSAAGDAAIDTGTSECAPETVPTPFPNVVFGGSRLDLSAFCGTLALPTVCPKGPAEVLQTYVCGPESTPPPLARDSGVQAAHRAIGCGFEFTNLCTMVTATATSDVPGPCDPACRPCAPCSLAQEQALRALPERPECDCSLPPGVDPCHSPTSCGCWCEQITRLKEACPGVR